MVSSLPNAPDRSNASRTEVRKDQMSATLADFLSEIGSLASAGGDLGMEKIKSVNGGSDQVGIESQNVNDVQNKEREKKITSDTEANKEMEPDMVSSHGVKLSDVRGCEQVDLVQNSKHDGSARQGTKASKNLDIECSMSFEPHESKGESSLDNDPVAAKVKLSDSDLVWAKVRSHPWWPGQVEEVFQKGSFLVTYFGDCSFAWNDASRIKLFRQHFSQMSKQSSLPDFLDVVDFALEEVSRRIEFSLACFCISEEVYEKIKTQTIIYPGSRQDSSSIHGGDKVSSAVFFEPINLVDYVKHLACSPSYDATEELQFVIQRASLLAFNRWKEYIESAPRISPAEKENNLFEVKKTEQVYIKKRKTQDQHDCKHDGVFEYEDANAPKKEKTLAESHEKSDKNPDCEKKLKVVHAELPKSSKKKIKANLHTEDSWSPLSPKIDDGKCNLSAGDKTTPKQAKTNFGIGASILRVANQTHSNKNGSGRSLQGRPKAEALSETNLSPNANPSRPHSASATKTSNGKPNPISIDSLQSGELEHASKETHSTNLVGDSMLESMDLKDSSK
ncbi:hypothetical protein N665_1141s0016 [Sinapis alba]|nr:hypothetical protein N665_1141s0016 [Sinapis alba]